MNRREFFKALGALVAAPLVKPAAVAAPAMGVATGTTAATTIGNRVMSITYSGDWTRTTWKADPIDIDGLKFYAVDTPAGEEFPTVIG